MKTRPILFSGPMVRALLEGRKTQTRRVVKPHPDQVFFPGATSLGGGQPLWPTKTGAEAGDMTCPYGKTGDRLWVRETWGVRHDDHLQAKDPQAVLFRATGGEKHENLHQLWRPSIFMPRWASRLTLEITEVRVERLQDISEEDAKAEGAEPDDISKVGLPAYSARQNFERLWDSINAKRGYSWDSNPWVWAISFRRLQ